MDGWDAFTAAPAAAGPAAAPPPPAPGAAPVAAAAPVSDGWEAFTAPAAPAAGAPGSQSPGYATVPTRPVEPDEPGYSPTAVTNLSKADYAAFNAGIPAAAPDTRKTGYLANIAARGNAALAGAAGAPVDLATGALNLGIRGVNAATGTNIPPIVDPVGGSGTLKRAMGVIGANPDDVRADGLGQEIAGGIAGGVVSAMIPAGAVSGLVRGGVLAADTAPAVLAALGDATPTNAVLGGASGGASDAAASQVPDQWKPIAGLAGGLAGVGVPLAAAAGVRGAVRAAGDYVAPFAGRVNPVADLAGDVPTMADGTPINMLTPDAKTGAAPPLAATAGQQRLAGERLLAASSDPAGVRETLAQQGPPAVPGNPTTPQLTRDPKLLSAERGISRVLPDAQGPYLQRAAEENDTRVGQVRAIAGAGDPAALPAALQADAAAQDVAGAARVAGVQAQTAGDVAATDAAGQARVAGLRQTAGETRAAIGGDLPAGSEGDVGAAVRAPLAAHDAAAKEAEGALWQAIDPDGKLAVDMTPVKRGAAGILRDISPNAAPLAGNEAGVFATASQLPDVQSFRDLSALRGRVTDAIRQERGPQGDPQAVRRMSMLLGHVNEAMSGAAAEAEVAPAAGPVFRPGDTPTSDHQAGRHDLFWRGVAAETRVRTIENKAALDRGEITPEQARAAIEAEQVRAAHAHDALSTTKTMADGSVYEGAPAVSTPTTAAGTGAAPRTGTRAYTPDGQGVDVRYGVREAADLTPSQLPDGRANPSFPQELQPRDRSRAASQVQVNAIADKLNPELLGASASTAEGAPIIGPDGVVESGNGRTLAIQQAYAKGGPQADAYRQWVAAQGHDVSGMRAPVLVRERTTPMDMAERAKFADRAGASPVLGMSATERAAADGKRLSGDMLGLVRDGDLSSAANGDFARAFAEHVLPPGERAGFMTADGTLSQEGVARMQHALVHRAYGSGSLVSTLAESTEGNIRALGGALVDAAGPMARLRGAIESGSVAASRDLGPTLTEAANLVQSAQRARLSLADAVGQTDAFSKRGDLVESVLRAAYGDDLTGRMSRGKFADLLGYYADKAQEQSSLFGANESSGEMLADAERRYGYGTSNTRTSGGSAADLRPGAGGNGNQALGPDPGAAGQGGAGGGGAFKADTTPPLTANFDAEARARYDAARAATADRKGGFDGAPGVKLALQGGSTGGSFKMADAAVAAAVIKPGAAGADHARVYLAKGGDPEALAGAAAFSLRRAAQRADGTLDPADVANWADKHASFLSALPDAAARFGAAADAQRAVDAGVAGAAAELKAATAVAQKTVNEASAAQAAAVKERQASVIGKFLGQADPVTMVAKILASPTSVADMRTLAGKVANSPDARAGLQAAVGEHILRALKGDAATAGGVETSLYGAQLQKFIRLHEDALGEIMSPEQMASLHRVAASLEQTNLSASASKLPGGSDTQQIGAAGRKAAPSTFMDSLKGLVFAKLGTGLGGAFGFMFGGSVTAGLAGAGVGFAGDMVTKSLQAAREAGMSTVDDLFANAMLHPQLAAVLLAKVTDQNRESLGRALVSQLRRISLVSSAVGYQDKGVRSPPRNVLTH